LELEATVEDMMFTIHAHPTVSEGMLDAFSAVEGKAINAWEAVSTQPMSTQQSALSSQHSSSQHSSSQHSAHTAPSAWIA